MAIGKVYDSNETTRLDDFISTKTANLEAANSDQNKNTKIINYSLLLMGAIITLVSLKLMLRKKK
jgi:hypothetical protein